MNTPLHFVWPARIGAILLLIIYGTPLYWLVSTSFKSGSQVFGGLSTFLSFPQPGRLSARLERGPAALGDQLFPDRGRHDVSHPGARRAGRVRTRTLAGLCRIRGSGAGDLPADDAALLLPFCTLLLRPFFLAIPFEIEEAATVDGASPWRVFSRTVLPLALNGTVTAGIIIFLIAWASFCTRSAFSSTQPSTHSAC